ncbi:hypothetical protein C8F04DRAFT_950211 [Mycena alexandri]|uniref:Uncharacterized protein n=1 Tax=Mycena alexandri TaxID=1745969 RepID=A0AAD6T4V7_9AGAR|nr:hypothetical protein C8F04DRAFT_950211 [Mycena alexandri]
MIAVELALRAVIAAKMSSVHIVLRSDNQGVIGALAAGRSFGIQENNVLQHVLQLFHDHDIWFTIVYVPSAMNIADAPSRGELPPREERFEFPPPIPKHLRDFIYSVR